MLHHIRLSYMGSGIKFWASSSLSAPSLGPPSLTVEPRIVFLHFALGLQMALCRLSRVFKRMRERDSQPETDRGECCCREGKLANDTDIPASPHPTTLSQLHTPTSRDFA